RGRGGILLAHRARRGVARVREARLAGLFELTVQGLELAARHEDFAAHLDGVELRHSRAETDGQALDRPEVRGDLLAHAAVTARGAAHEAAPLVAESDAAPVDLRLADVAERGAGQRALDARLEFAELVRRRGVVEREHRH